MSKKIFEIISMLKRVNKIIFIVYKKLMFLGI